jgi:hypothetical protein
VRPGSRIERSQVRSITANVDDTQAIAIRGGHAAGDIASIVVVTAGITDAEAAEVVMMMMEAPATTAPRLGRSGGGSQRHGAERSSGNKGESQFA